MLNVEASTVTPCRVSMSAAMAANISLGTRQSAQASGDAATESSTTVPSSLVSRRYPSAISIARMGSSAASTISDRVMAIGIRRLAAHYQYQPYAWTLLLQE